MFEMLAISPLVRAIGLALIHFVWQGALIGGAAVCLFHAFRRSSAATRYAVGCVLLLAMVAAPLLTTLRALDRPPATASAAAEPMGRSDARPIAGAPSTTLTSAPDPAPTAVLNSAWGECEEAGLQTGLQSGSCRAEGAAQLLPAVVLVWISGVAILTLSLTRSWMHARQLRRAPLAAAYPFAAQLERLARQLGLRQRVSLAASSAIDVPTLVGWMRPVILVPGSVLTGLTPAQLDAVLVHELAHVRRHDYAVNLVQTATETLLFYHPAVWWLSARVRLERELCCDDVVVATGGDRLVYARALASLEELRIRTPALALSATGGSLVNRIRRLLAPELVDPSRSSAWTVVAAAVLIAPAVLIGGGVEQPVEREHAGSQVVATASAPAPSVPVTSPAIPNPSVPVTAEASLSPSSPVSPLDPTSSVSPAGPVSATVPVTPPARLLVPVIPVPLINVEPEVVVVTPQVQPGPGASNDEAAVLALEEEFRLAKVRNDVSALERLLDENYRGTNQNGSTRDKAETIELWRSFHISLLTLDDADVEVAGDLATVRGRQTEVNPTGTDDMLFTRIWRRMNGAWRLFSVTQFRNPNPTATPRASSSTAAQMTPVQLMPVQYELFRDGVLLGRPTMTVVTGRPWAIRIPGETAVTGLAVPSGDGRVTLTFTPTTADGPSGTLVLKGSAPAESSWTSGGRTYRLRAWNAASNTTAAAPVSIGPGMPRPEVIRMVSPRYPDAAKAAGVEGTVMMELVLDEAGYVRDARIVRSVPMLDQAALDAVRQWQYAPTLVNGTPVPVRMTAQITFATN